MSRLLGIALAAVIAAAAMPAYASVTWTFEETACTDALYGGPCKTYGHPPVAFPFPLVTLTLPGPTSSGSAVWTGEFGPPPVFTGDPFDLSFGPGLTSTSTVPPVGFGCSLASRVLCSFNLSWTEISGVLDAVSLSVQWADTDLGSGFGLTGGIFGTDGDIDDCHFALCVATGYWRSNITFAGTPGQANCHGQSVSALAKQYGGVSNAASQLGYSSVSALQDAVAFYCEGSSSMARDFTVADPAADPIPEPTSIALLGASLAGFAGVCLRRRSRTKGRERVESGR